jgi:integrase
VSRPDKLGSFWLSKRPGSKMWCRTWFDVGTRQTCRASLGTDDLERARLELAKWVTLHGQRGQQEAREALISDVFVRYQQQHGRHTRGASASKRNLVLILERLPPGLSVAELTLEQQQRVVTRMQADRYSAGTIKRAWGIAKAAVSWSWRNGELDRPVPFLRLPEGPGRERTLTVEELAHLWDAEMPAHIRVFLALLIGTGSRPEALLQLSRFQCDLRAGTINLNLPGREQTKKRRPIIPMADWLHPWIEAADGPLVQFRGRPVEKVAKAFRSMREAAGLGPDVTAYTLRHTVATQLMMRGVPELEIAALLGHTANIRTTGRYIHVSPNYLGNARRALDDLASGIGRLACRSMSPDKLRVSSVLVSLPRTAKPLIFGAGDGIRTHDPDLGKDLTSKPNQGYKPAKVGKTKHAISEG